MNKKIRVAVVSNIPAPYRIDVFRRFADSEDIDARVFYCSGREPNREWDLPPLSFDHHFLKASFIAWRGRYIHTNPDVWAQLRAWRPEVIVTTGFNPTHLMAYVYARWHRCVHVAMTDGTLASESSSLSAVHRWIRQHVYARTAAFIGACEGTFALYRSYGIADQRMFKSHLCADNPRFAQARAAQTSDQRCYDFMFCGRFASVKNPLFALQVCQGVARRLGRRLAIAMVGSGDEEAALRQAAQAMQADVEVHFLGFARQGDLPQHYARSKIFLFPTAWDPWGVVANEACAAGVPVLISPAAGSAGELVRDGVNGYVLPLTLSAWVQAAQTLLTDAPLRQRMACAAVDAVAEYTYAFAAHGMVTAVRAAVGRAKPEPVVAQILPWSQRTTAAAEGARPVPTAAPCPATVEMP